MDVRALIVDDNVEYLHVAKMLLELEGIIVVDIAASGPDALRSAQEYHPDVVLVDVDLGDESGFDVAEHLCSDGSVDAVVLISAYPEQDLDELIKTSPAIGFVSKSGLSAHAIIELLNFSGQSKNS